MSRIGKLTPEGFADYGGEMSPTLLEALAGIILVVLGVMIGLTIAPRVLRWFKILKKDVDVAADEANHPGTKKR